MSLNPSISDFPTPAYALNSEGIDYPHLSPAIHHYKRTAIILYSYYIQNLFASP
jgi:hypothetical protein